MNTVLIEPTDVLFFRDAIPMSAGQGRGAGCRLPFPSTMHEAFRGSLLRARGEAGLRKEIPGRPRTADRKGNWHAGSHDTDVRVASRAFRSLRTVGPLPFLGTDRESNPFVWEERRSGLKTGVRVSYSGLLLPVPVDAAYTSDRCTLARLQLWRDPSVSARQDIDRAAGYRPAFLPLASTPPDKHGPLHGWWTVTQVAGYLRGEPTNAREHFRPLPTDDLWKSEHRVGVQIDPGSYAAAPGQLYAGSYLRADKRVRLAAWTEIADPARAINSEAAARQRERDELARLDWLLLGGEFRLARLRRDNGDGQSLPDLFAPLRTPPEPPPGDGPCLLKWVLVTPAIFAHGSLPGWCAHPVNQSDGHPIGQVRLGVSARKPESTALPGRAHLVSWCLGKPRTVSGWDVVDDCAKPTLLAVPEGGVYYFLCEDRATAGGLARKLHWQPRSDFYGEKGCGYGLVSFDVHLHPTSADLRSLAREFFAA